MYVFFITQLVFIQFKNLLRYIITYVYINKREIVGWRSGDLPETLRYVRRFF